MTDSEKKHGFMDAVRGAAGHVSHAVMAGVTPHVADSLERIMKNVDERIRRLEERILKKVTTLLVLCAAAVAFLFALFFFLRAYLEWSSALACLVIGVVLLIIGLLLRTGTSSR